MCTSYPEAVLELVVTVVDDIFGLSSSFFVQHTTTMNNADAMRLILLHNFFPNV